MKFGEIVILSNETQSTSLRLDDRACTSLVFKAATGATSFKIQISNDNMTFYDLLDREAGGIVLSHTISATIPGTYPIDFAQDGLSFPFMRIVLGSAATTNVAIEIHGMLI